MSDAKLVGSGAGPVGGGVVAGKSELGCGASPVGVGKEGTISDGPSTLLAADLTLETMLLAAESTLERTLLSTGSILEVAGRAGLDVGIELGSLADWLGTAGEEITGPSVGCPPVLEGCSGAASEEGNAAEESGGAADDCCSGAFVSVGMGLSTLFDGIASEGSGSARDDGASEMLGTGRFDVGSGDKTEVVLGSGSLKAELGGSGRAVLSG